MNISSDQLVSAATRAIERIDREISLQLERIMAHVRFTELESLWRGLHALARLPVNNNRVRLRLLDCSWNEIEDDLNLPAAVRYSHLFQLVCNKEFNTAGGTPYGVILVNHLCGAGDSPSIYSDLHTADLFAQIGAEALCPIVMGLANDFFGDSEPELVMNAPRIDRIINSDDMSEWHLLRAQQHSRFLAFIWPRLLMRPVWSEHCYNFCFHATRPDLQLWGNSGFALLSNLMREFDRISWFGFIHQWELEGGQGAIINIDSDDSALQLFNPPRFNYKLHESQEEVYAANGIIPVTSCYLSTYSGIFCSPTVYACSSDEQYLNSLVNLLTGCRIAHYLKILIRDSLGEYITPAECENRLHKWLEQYTSNTEYADEEIAARFPLRQASVTVSDNSLLTGSYSCRISIVPQYLAEPLQQEIVIQADVFPGRRGI
ncbi:type VI secretion system contractile sheath domain-containing protein [Endozoicomonadaceae bacterium StTr2]